MTTQDQPRGSREAYERLSDPAMYWTQVNGRPIREPIRDPRREPPHSQHREEPRRQPEEPAQEPLLPWESEPAQDETVAADALPYDDEPAYADRPTYRSEGYRSDGYRSDGQRSDRYASDADLEAHEQFGGVNWGAGFFGWLVAVGFGVFLAALLAVAFAVLRRMVDAVPAMLDARPGMAAVLLGAAAVAVVMLAYYAGGYVAGRMSRFDGGRQGAGVWITGLLLTALALGVGLVFGSEYDVLARVQLPSVHVPSGVTGLGGLVGVVVTLVGSLLAAIGGGKVGCRYHRKVDEYL